MTTPPVGWNTFGMTQPSRDKYRQRLPHATYLPDDIMIIVAEYGSSLDITLFSYNSEFRSVPFDRIEPPREFSAHAKRLRGIDRIKCLASLEIRGVVLDVLPDLIWRERKHSLMWNTESSSLIYHTKTYMGMLSFNTAQF